MTIKGKEMKFTNKMVFYGRNGCCLLSYKSWYVIFNFRIKEKFYFKNSKLLLNLEGKVNEKGRKQIYENRFDLLELQLVYRVHYGTPSAP